MIIPIKEYMIKLVGNDEGDDRNDGDDDLYNDDCDDDSDNDHDNGDDRQARKKLLMNAILLKYIYILMIIIT